MQRRPLEGQEVKYRSVLRINIRTVGSGNRATAWSTTNFRAHSARRLKFNRPGPFPAGNKDCVSPFLVCASNLMGAKAPRRAKVWISFDPDKIWLFKARRGASSSAVAMNETFRRYISGFRAMLLEFEYLGSYGGSIGQRFREMWPCSFSICGLSPRGMQIFLWGGLFRRSLTVGWAPKIELSFPH